mgnify:CR=1 FL=1
MTNITKINTKEKDMEEPPEDSWGLSIEVVDNGWILRAINDDDEIEVTEVYQADQGKQLLKAVASFLGA